MSARMRKAIVVSESYFPIGCIKFIAGKLSCRRHFWVDCCHSSFIEYSLQELKALFFKLSYKLAGRGGVAPSLVLVFGILQFGYSMVCCVWTEFSCYFGKFVLLSKLQISVIIRCWDCSQLYPVKHDDDNTRALF